MIDMKIEILPLEDDTHNHGSRQERAGIVLTPWKEFVCYHGPRVEKAIRYFGQFVHLFVRWQMPFLKRSDLLAVGESKHPWLKMAIARISPLVTFPFAAEDVRATVLKMILYIIQLRIRFVVLRKRHADEYLRVG